MKSIVSTLTLIAALSSANAWADGLDISRKDISCVLKSLTDSTSETLFIPRPDLRIGIGEGGTGFQGLTFESKNLPDRRLGISVWGIHGRLVQLNLPVTSKSSATIYESGMAVVELTCTPVGH